MSGSKALSTPGILGAGEAGLAGIFFGVADALIMSGEKCTQTGVRVGPYPHSAEVTR